jgi:hypothetical protein
MLTVVKRRTEFVVRTHSGKDDDEEISRPFKSVKEVTQFIESDTGASQLAQVESICIRPYKKKVERMLGVLSVALNIAAKGRPKDDPLAVEFNTSHRAKNVDLRHLNSIIDESPLNLALHLNLRAIKPHPDSKGRVVPLSPRTKCLTLRGMETSDDYTSWFDLSNCQLEVVQFGYTPNNGRNMLAIGHFLKPLVNGARDSLKSLQLSGVGLYVTDRTDFDVWRLPCLEYLEFDRVPLHDQRQPQEHVAVPCGAPDLHVVLVESGPFQEIFDFPTPPEKTLPQYAPKPFPLHVALQFLKTKFKESQEDLISTPPQGLLPGKELQRCRGHCKAKRLLRHFKRTTDDGREITTKLCNDCNRAAVIMMRGMLANVKDASAEVAQWPTQNGVELEKHCGMCGSPLKREDFEHATFEGHECVCCKRCSEERLLKEANADCAKDPNLVACPNCCHAKSRELFEDDDGKVHKWCRPCRITRVTGMAKWEELQKENPLETSDPDNLSCNSGDHYRPKEFEKGAKVVAQSAEQTCQTGINKRKSDLETKTAVSPTKRQRPN